MMCPLRVLLVDDSPEFLQSAIDFLSNDSRVEVVGHALSGGAALALAEQTRPDLMLIDFSMPEMNGLETTGAIKARPGAPCVIIMSLHEDPEYCTAAAASGADGFIRKSAFSVSMLQLIASLFAESAR